MKVHITLTDQNGAVFEGEAELAPAETPGKKRAVAKPSPGSDRTVMREPPPRIDFSVNERAFMKAHARGLSGSRKFALVVAYLAKGEVGKEVQLADVRESWNRMTGLLGSFNLNFPTVAKENGWVDSKKRGVYVLTSSWKEALKHGNG